MKKVFLSFVLFIFLVSISFTFAAPTQTCYAVHGAYESIGGHGWARTFDNVSFAISDTAHLLKSEYKFKDGGVGPEAPPADTSWHIFKDKQDVTYSYANSSFFTDVYSNNTVISGIVYVSAECKDADGEGQLNWTLYEYSNTSGIVDILGSQVWDATKADDPVDSQLSISNYTVSEGNRLLLRVYGKLDAVPISGELKFKLDEAGAETSTTVTSTYCSNVHSTYKSFLVMVLSEEIILDDTAPEVEFEEPTSDSGSYRHNYISANVSASDDNLDSIIIQLFNSTGLLNWSVSLTSPFFFNFTGLSDGTYYLNASANDSLGNVNYTETRTIVLDNTRPSVLFNFQSPADMDTFNLFYNLLNISYNISDNIALNTSSVKFYYKTNSSSSNYFIYTNGSRLDSSMFLTGYVNISNNSNVWYFKLSESNIYPATYNYNETRMESTIHSSYELDNKKDMMKVRLFNVSNSKKYSFLEVMVKNNNIAGTKALRVFYCNSSYVSGKPRDSPSCTNFYNLPAQTAYAHNHSGYSSHQVIPFSMNLTTGKINEVLVTSISYFIFRGEKDTSSYNIYYISNVSRANTIQLSTGEGVTWSNFLGTVDAHLHQYDGTEKFLYYACANDTLNNQNCSSVRLDYFNLTDLPPTAPNVYAPVEGFYRGNITINYSSAISPEGYSISYYNISLVDANETFVQTIKSNNSLNLSYIWDSSGVANAGYFIRVEACDNKSLCSFGFSKNITIDNTAPQVQFVSLTTANGNYSQDFIVANVTANDTLLNTTRIYLYNSTGLVNSTSSSSSPFFVNFTNLLDGIYYLNATANDTLGHLNQTETRTIVLDTTAPLIEFVEPTTNTTNCSRNWIVGNVTASDMRLNTTIIYLYNSSGFVNSSAGTFINFTGLSDGIYYLNASANDSLGNVNSTETRTITIDTIPPAIVIYSPLNQTYGLNGAVLVNLTTNNGDSIWYNWNGTNVTYTTPVNVTFDEGINTLIVYANDSCGNTNNTNITFTIDNTAPSLEIVSPINQSYNNATILVNISSDGDNVWYNWNGTNASYSAPLNVTFDEGINNLIVYANDSVGNLNFTDVTFIVDTIAPLIGFVASTTSGNQSQDFIVGNVSVVDLTLDSVTVYLYNFSGLVNSSIGTFVNFSGLVDGVYYLNASANDSFGNVNSTETITILLDTSKPLIEFVEPTTNTTNCSRDWIVGNITVSDFTLDTVIIYLYNSSGLVNSTTDTFVNFTGLGDGTYYLNASANDSFGNLNVTETRTIIVHTTPPTVNIISPLNQSYNVDMILVNISDNNYNISYNWNGTNVTYTSPVNVTFDEGNNTLIVYVTDGCGLSNSSNVTFFVDTIAPSLEIISPSNIGYGNATVLVNISSDGGNIWYNWNGTNVTYTTPVNVTFDGGSNTLVVYANDSFGNLNFTNITFIVDFNGPVVTLLSPINGTSVTASSTVTFSYNVTDDSIIENCSLIINEVLESTDITIIRNTTQTFGALLTNGDYNWSINCTDVVSNENSSVAENFTLNYIAPIIPPASGGGGGGGGGSSFFEPVLECINDSGCAEEQYCLNNECFDYECNTDSECNDTKTCWMHRCVKLFDMKIIDVESPIFPGESFPFTYFIKGVAEIHGDVIVRFWLERDGEIVTEGFDTIYMADFEEKTESTELFLPGTIAEGTYNFYAEVNYDSYYAKASRVIDVGVVSQEEVQEGLLTGQTIADVGDAIKNNGYFLLVILGILVLFGIIYWERRELEKALIPEERWLRRHKLSIGGFLFLVVSLGVLYYAAEAGMIRLSPIRITVVKIIYLIGVIVVLTVILVRARLGRLLSSFWELLKDVFNKRRYGVEEKNYEPIIRKVKPVAVLVKPKTGITKPKKIGRIRRPTVTLVRPRAGAVKAKLKAKRASPPKKKAVVRKPVGKKHIPKDRELERIKAMKKKILKIDNFPREKIITGKESLSPDRDFERIKSMEERISGIDKKSVSNKSLLKEKHPDLKKELKKIKSGISRSK